jgi:hypothetical protein
MSLNIIPALGSIRLNNAEKKIARKLEEIYRQESETSWLYIQLRMGDPEPDFILIDPERGVCVIEVMNWRKDLIQTVEPATITLSSGIKGRNPALKNQQAFDQTQGLLRGNSNLWSDAAEFIVPVYARLIFTNMDRDDLTEWHQNFERDPVFYLGSEEIPTMTPDSLYGGKCVKLSDGHIQNIRITLIPEIRVNPPTVSVNLNQDASEIIRALDAEQEIFAKRLPFGHYMVTGIPGSGKTVILLSRALHLIKYHPEWKILLVTYNVSLKNRIESRLEALDNALSVMGIDRNNIETKTFHATALEIARISVPQPTDQSFWDTTLPNLALQRAIPSYDAVLADEYQDFLEDWLRLCIKICKTHEYTRVNGEEAKARNLLLVGDRLQGIYRRPDFSFNSLGINMRGRSKILKKTYRTGNEHIRAALKILMSHNQLREEVEKFYEGIEDVTTENYRSTIKFISGSYEEVAGLIDSMLQKGICKPQDILVLGHTWGSLRGLNNNLSGEASNYINIGKYVQPGKINLTTYHSAKGLESNTCILLDVSEFNKEDPENLKLLYVGMTRASQYLYLHQPGEFESLL